MKTLSAPLTGQITAAQAGYCELYDIYLPSAIVTPWGTVSILRLCDFPAAQIDGTKGISFYTPKIAPEATGTQGNAQFYNYWPIKRETVQGESKFANDKLNIIASNVTTEWAQMIAGISWYDVSIVIRKISTTIAAPTADDCAIIWGGEVDGVKITEQTIQLECSSDMATMTAVQPAQNMHDNCRFTYGDDFCTQIILRPENFKAKTAGSGSTTTQVNSADLTEDIGSAGSYGTDLVDALPSTSITGSTELNQNTKLGVIAVNTSTDQLTTEGAPGSGDIFLITTLGTLPAPLAVNTLYTVYQPVVVQTGRNGVVISTAFKVKDSSGNVINLTSAGTLNHTNCLFLLSLTINTALDFITIQTGIGAKALISNGEPVSFFANTLPAPLVAGTIYYAINVGTNGFQICAAPPTFGAGGQPINFSTAGSNVQLYLFRGPASTVRTSNLFGWKMGNHTDWGTNDSGYWRIPDSQAGITNPALTPSIQFDFGSAVTPSLWRVSSMPNARMEELIKMISFFSSPDGSTWKFERHFELPPIGGTLFDARIPAATNARYWQICVRTRWAQALYYSLFYNVQAYATSLHYWASGRIIFAANTTTVALRGKSARVRESYNGQIIVDALPTAPVNGDTFTIQRGCPRTFNGCAERLNTENFGGFTTLPYQTVVRNV